MADTIAKISFKAKLHRPAGTGKTVTWTFLKLPRDASEKLPSRGMASVEGTFNGFAFQATLAPDGQGGHWLKVDRELREAAGAEAGKVVRLEIAPAAVEPEPELPPGLRAALAAASPKARESWSSITTLARRDWIQWIEAAKQEKTRLKRSKTPATCSPRGSGALAVSTGRDCTARASAAPLPKTNLQT